MPSPIKVTYTVYSKQIVLDTTNLKEKAAKALLKKARKIEQRAATIMKYEIEKDINAYIKNPEHHITIKYETFVRGYGIYVRFIQRIFFWNVFFMGVRLLILFSQNGERGCLFRQWANLFSIIELRNLKMLLFIHLH